MLTEDLASRSLDPRFAPAKPVSEITLDVGSSDTIRIPDAHLMFQGEYRRDGFDLVIEDEDRRVVVSDYFRAGKRPTLESPEGARLTDDIVAALAVSDSGLRYAQATPPAPTAAIGRVETVTGQATVIRNGTPVVLNQGDPVFKGDVVQTDRSSSLGITFVDGSSFSLASGARMVLNDMVYQPGGTQNSSLLNIVQGSVTFLAGQVAKTGDMRVGTPVATMGIRGTLVTAEVNANDGTTKFAVVREQNGEVGRFVLLAPDGRVIANVSVSGEVTTVTPTGVVSTAPQTAAERAAEQLVVAQVYQIFSLGQANPILPSQQPPTQPGPQGPGGGGSSSTPPGDSGTSTPPQSPPPLAQQFPTRGDGFEIAVAVPSQQTAAPITLTGTPVVVVETTPPVISARAGALGGDGAFTSVSRNGSTVVQGSYGTLLVSADGTYSYVPNNAARIPDGQTREDVFTTQDAAGTQKEIAVTVTGTNDRPSAQPFGAAVVQDGTVARGNLLAGASDPDEGETATLRVSAIRAGDVSSSAAPSAVSSVGDTVVAGLYGTLTVRADGTYSYAASNAARLGQGTSAEDVFTFTISDRSGGTATETARFTVSGVNDAPVVTAALVFSDVFENTSAFSIDLLAGAFDRDAGDTLTVGSLSFTVDGGPSSSTPPAGLVRSGATLTVDPSDPAFDGLASGQTQTITVSYLVIDSAGATAAQTATVTIQGTNDAPTATNLSGTVTYGNGASSVDLPDIVIVDPDFRDTITATLTLSDIAAGTLSGGGGTYDPATGVWTFSGTVGAANAALAAVVFNPAPLNNSSATITTHIQDASGAGPADGSIALQYFDPATGNALINGLGGARGFGESFLAANDDSSTGAIDVTSVFGTDGIRFGDTVFTSIYVNNNGNVTFGSPTGDFTPKAFDTVNLLMIAPLWYDIETRDTANSSFTPRTPGGNSTGSNLVWYDSDAALGTFTVTWDDVSDFSDNTRASAFQLQMIDRGGEDFDFVYRYEAVNLASGRTSVNAGYDAGSGPGYQLPQAFTTGAANLETTSGNTGQTGVWEFHVRNGTVGTDVLTSSAALDVFTGRGGADVFVFRAGQANGDAVLDFSGAVDVSGVAGAGDRFQFQGYGSAAAGATFTQIDATHWQVNSADGTLHEVITLANSAPVGAADYLFV